MSDTFRKRWPHHRGLRALSPTVRFQRIKQKIRDRGLRRTTQRRKEKKP